MDQAVVPDDIAELAVGWFARLRAPQVTEAVCGSFIRWLGEAQVHQQAFVEIIRLWEGLAVIKEMNFEELYSLPQIREFKQELQAEAKVAG